MYPRISDIFNDFLGTEFCLPIQSFGFMVAVAFIVAYYLLQAEMRRKTLQGIFPTRKEKVQKGGPIKESEILINFLIFGFLGYKLGLMFDDYNVFCSEPQKAILSLKGSIPAGLIAGLLGGGWKFWQYLKKKNDKVEESVEELGIEQELGMIMTIGFVAGILGAKIFHNLEDWDTFIQDPGRALLSFDGLTFYGGLICAGAGIIWWVRKKGYKLLPFLDANAPGLILAYGVGRIGCQLAGDGDWGIDNLSPKPGWMSFLPDWMWSFTYPHNVLRMDSGNAIPGCTGDYCNELLNPVWPTPFYETIMCVILFIGLWSIRKRLKFWGQMFGIYLFFNGLERFFIEKIRVNIPYHIGGMEITQAEIISSLLMLGGLVLFLMATFKWKLREASSDT